MFEKLELLFLLHFVWTGTIHSWFLSAEQILKMDHPLRLKHLVSFGIASLLSWNYISFLLEFPCHYFSLGIQGTSFSYSTAKDYLVLMVVIVVIFNIDIVVGMRIAEFFVLMKTSPCLEIRMNDIWFYMKFWYSIVFSYCGLEVKIFSFSGNIWFNSSSFCPLNELAHQYITLLQEKA